MLDKLCGFNITLTTCCACSKCFAVQTTEKVAQEDHTMMDNTAAHIEKQRASGNGTAVAHQKQEPPAVNNSDVHPHVTASAMSCLTNFVDSTLH